MKRSLSLKTPHLTATFSVSDRKKDLEQLASDIDPFNVVWDQLTSHQQLLLRTLKLDLILQQDPYQFTKLLLEAIHTVPPEGQEPSITSK